MKDILQFNYVPNFRVLHITLRHGFCVDKNFIYLSFCIRLRTLFRRQYSSHRRSRIPHHYLRTGVDGARYLPFQPPRNHPDTMAPSISLQPVWRPNARIWITIQRRQSSSRVLRRRTFSTLVSFNPFIYNLQHACGSIQPTRHWPVRIASLSSCSRVSQILQHHNTLAHSRWIGPTHGSSFPKAYQAHMPWWNETRKGSRLLSAVFNRRYFWRSLSHRCGGNRGSTAQEKVAFQKA